MAPVGVWGDGSIRASLGKGAMLATASAPGLSTPSFSTRFQHLASAPGFRTPRTPAAAQQITPGSAHTAPTLSHLIQHIFPFARFAFPRTPMFRLPHNPVPPVSFPGCQCAGSVGRRSRKPQERSLAALPSSVRGSIAGPRIEGSARGLGHDVTSYQRPPPNFHFPPFPALEPI